jgi:Domain of unknown function (DUF4032)/Lipopolysaccharide kinase (Kdo/WaaP) family
LPSPTFSLVARTGYPSFVDLPWQLPLTRWPSDILVELERGIGRHVVRFVEADGSYYALKELPREIAAREHSLLRRLESAELPAVEAVALVRARRSEAGEELPSVLITRYLDYSLPYRVVLRRRFLPAPLGSLLDSFAGLLVRLHLGGFFWGDCSLSNTLFRRDAGELSAYLVDAETGELHPELSYGQRRHDLLIAEENLVGELHDIAAELGPEQQAYDPLELATDVRERYERLWAELTEEEEFGPDEPDRLERRLRRLNELGFDVEEFELHRTENGFRLVLHSKVVEPGHHRRRLLRLTGLNAQENQARRLLNDLTAFRARLEESGAPPVSEAAAAGRWLSEVFEPAVAAIPPELRGKRAAAEVFHELLEHGSALAEQQGDGNVTLEAAIASYVDNVLRAAPDERAAIVRDEA